MRADRERRRRTGNEGNPFGGRATRALAWLWLVLALPGCSYDAVWDGLQAPLVRHQVGAMLSAGGVESRPSACEMVGLEKEGVCQLSLTDAELFALVDAAGLDSVEPGSLDADDFDGAVSRADDACAPAATGHHHPDHAIYGAFRRPGQFPGLDYLALFHEIETGAVCVQVGYDG